MSGVPNILRWETGPMGAGKSSAVLDALLLAERANRRTVLIRPGIDTRYATLEGHPVTWDRRCHPAQFVSRLEEVILDEEVTDIGIDEGHMFPDLVEFCRKWFVSGRNVYVAALNGDSEQKPFPNLLGLESICTKIRVHTSICSCGATAFWSIRYDRMRKTQIVVGGEDMYGAVCLPCLKKHRGEKIEQ